MPFGQTNSCALVFNRSDGLNADSFALHLAELAETHMTEPNRGIYLGDDRRLLLARLQSLVADLGATEFPDPSNISVVMDQWQVGKREVPCLLGSAFGHPKFFDGSLSISSELFYLDVESGIARTLSRWYRLGSRSNLER